MAQNLIAKKIGEGILGLEHGIWGYMFGRADGVREGKELARREVASEQSGGGVSKDPFELLAIGAAGLECAVIVLATHWVAQRTGVGDGVDAIVTIAAAVPLIAFYLALHGAWSTTLLSGVVLTPIWTAGVYFWENPPARVQGRFLDTCSTVERCVHHVFPDTHLAWGWTLFACFASLLLRGFIFIYFVRRQDNSHSFYAPIVRSTLWARAWMWCRRLGIAIVVAAILGFLGVIVLKACASEERSPSAKIHRKA